MSLKNNGAYRDYHAVRRQKNAVSRRGINGRVEELGKLNDEHKRLEALPEIDSEGYLKLARKYHARGMCATAKMILIEGNLDESML